MADVAAGSIAIDRLTKRFGDRLVLDSLELRVEPGEWFLLLGPNGAGKTTAIKLILGLLRPTSGRVMVHGLEPRRDAHRLRLRTGYLPESFHAYPYLSGREYLGFVADVYGLDREEKRRRIGELIELFELTEAADRLAQGYSQGMAKKVGLAAALLPRPDLLVLDEPTGNLDARSANLVRTVLRGLAEGGTTILMSTHILGLTEKLCHRVGILHQGRLELLASMPELAARFPDRSLEEVFLSVTGELEDQHIEGFLDRWRGEG